MYKTNEDIVKDFYVDANAKFDSMMVRNNWSIWSSGIKISADCSSERLAWKNAKDRIKNG